MASGTSHRCTTANATVPAMWPGLAPTGSVAAPRHSGTGDCADSSWSGLGLCVGTHQLALARPRPKCATSSTYFSRALQGTRVCPALEVQRRTRTCRTRAPRHCVSSVEDKPGAGDQLPTNSTFTVTTTGTCERTRRAAVEFASTCRHHAVRVGG